MVQISLQFHRWARGGLIKEITCEPQLKGGRRSAVRVSGERCSRQTELKASADASKQKSEEQREPRRETWSEGP